MLHVLTETNRHAGHADILSEQLHDAARADSNDVDRWAAHRSAVETAALLAERES